MRQIRFFLGFAALVAIFISCSDPIGPDPPKDTTPPKVVKTVPPDSFITTETEFIPLVVFSEPVVLGKAMRVDQITLAKLISGQWKLSLSRDSLFFYPSNPFTPGSKYEMLLSGIKDDAGNVMPDYTFCWFVVSSTVAVDTIPPVVVSSIPQDGATSVPVNVEISDKFSEHLDSATVNNSTYKLLKDGNQVPASVSYSDFFKKATLIPNTNLEYGTTYEVVLTSAITDTAGNHLVATSRSFTTENAPDITPPEVINSIPQDGATDVDINVVISDEFSEPLDPASITGDSYKLMKDNVQVPAVVSYSGLTATLTPNSPLEYETTYEVVLTADITDKAGNHFPGSTRSFTTEADPNPRWTLGSDYINNVIDVDAMGNLYIGAHKLGDGYTTDSVAIGKIDQNGTVLWKRNLDAHPTLVDQPFGIAYESGFVYILRTQDPGTGYGTVYIDKLSPSGDSAWTIYLTGPNELAADIDVYGGYIYAATEDELFMLDQFGSVVNTVSISDIHEIFVDANAVYVGSGIYSARFKAYDHDLNFMWERIFDTPLFEVGGSVVTHNGYVYFSGATGDLLNGIPMEPFLIKCDLNGSVLWDSTYTGIQPPGNPYRRFITCDDAGDVYMVAGPVKFSAYGDKLWQRNIPGHQAVVFNNILFVTVADRHYHSILRFDAQTGAEIQ